MVVCKNLRLLLVDDDPVDREHFIRLVKKTRLAVDVIPVDSAAAAEEVLRAGPVDCVVLDYHLVGAEGTELIAGLKELQKKPLPVIMVTGTSDEDVVVAAMRAGAYDYLFKGRLTAVRIQESVDGAIAWAALENRVLEAENAQEEAELALSESRQRLMASEAQLRGFFDSAVTGMALAGSDGLFVRVNHELCVILGYEPAELVGVSVASLAHADDQAAEAEAVRAVLAGELSVYWGETRFLHRQGDTIWLKQSLAPVYNEAGEVLLLAAQFQDVRVQREAENALRQRERRLRAFVELAPIGIFETDAAGGVTFVNPRWCENAGVLYADALGDGWLDAVHPDDRAAVLREWQGAAEERREFVLDYRFLRSDGTVTWVAGRALALHDEGGGLSGYLGAVANVTQQKAQERLLLEARDAAEETVQAKSDFLARMSHEIRTPMNIVIGMTELTLGTSLTREQRDYVFRVNTSAKDLLRIINDILDVSKIEAGHLRLDKIAFKLREQVGRALLGLSMRAYKKGLEFATTIPENVPNSLLGDPHRLQQILINLVANSLKFTMCGEVVVSVAVDSETEDEVTLQFTVMDTGVGVPENKQQRIFSAFEQADVGAVGHHAGTGLGLTICAQLVEMMDGRIWVESRPGEGSKFHFVARFGKQEVPIPRLSQLPRRLSALVVEDHPRTRSGVCDLLESWDIRSSWASNREQALEVLAQRPSDAPPLDLILLDSTLPDCSTQQLASELLALCPKAKWILLTGGGAFSNDETSETADGPRLRAVTKPIIASELLSALQEELGLIPLKLQPSSRPPPQSQSHPLRVLVAEDNPMNQHMMQIILKRGGHTVTMVEDGQAALDMLLEQEFDLVLMDVQMPTLDGLEATKLQRERESETGQHIPIVALTAQAMKEDRARCLSAGMDEYVTKPLDLEVLERVMNKLYTKHRRPPVDPKPSSEA